MAVGPPNVYQFGDLYGHIGDHCVITEFVDGSVWGKLVVEAVCLIITLPIIYGYMWGQGDRDANFVQFGRMQPDMWKGLRAGLLAIIPTVLTCIPLALSMMRVLASILCLFIA